MPVRTAARESDAPRRRRASACGSFRRPPTLPVQKLRTRSSRHTETPHTPNTLHATARGTRCAAPRRRERSSKSRCVATVLLETIARRRQRRRRRRRRPARPHQRRARCRRCRRATAAKSAAVVVAGGRGRCSPPEGRLTAGRALKVLQGTSRFVTKPPNHFSCVFNEGPIGQGHFRDSRVKLAEEREGPSRTSAKLKLDIRKSSIAVRRPPP